MNSSGFVRRRTGRPSRVARTAVALGVLWLASVGSAPPAAASEIVVLGDSWGVLFGPVVRDKLDAEGFAALDLTNLSVGGSTAASWSSGSQGDLGVLLGGHPDAEIVQVSLGGNDLIGGLSNPVGALNQAISDTVSVLGDIVSATAASVLITGYDYLPNPIPGVTHGQVNLFLDLYIDGVAAAVAADAGLASQVTVLDTHGLMQVHFGVPQAGIAPFDPSLPDSTLPGPTTAFADSIHLNAAGYGVYVDEVYDLFYAPALLPEPGAALLLGLAFAALQRRRRHQR